jgi:hypothetical protein
VKCGWGYWRITTEWCDESAFEQDIKIERVRNPFSVYLDPAAERQDASDARWLFIVERMSKETFEQKYPDARTDWNEYAAQGDDREWWWGEDFRRVAEYWEVTEEPVTYTLLVDPMTGQRITTEMEVPEALQGNILAQREGTKRKVTQRIITGQEVLEENEWPGKYIPIVRVVGREVDVEGEIYLKGMVRDLRDVQRQYNYMRSASVERIALYPKSPFIGPKGAFKDPKWRRANTKAYAYLEYEPVAGMNPPRREPPPDVSPGLVTEIQAASQEFKEVTGIYSAGLGDRSNEVSGVAIDSRRAEADVSNFDFIDNVARAMKYTGKILVDLIPKIYSGQRVIRILKPDGSEEAVQVNAPYMDDKMKERNYQLSAGRYDVAVDVGPSYATQREEARESMLDVLAKFPEAARFVADLVAKNMDWPDADEFAKRMKALVPPEVLDGDNPQMTAAIAQRDQQIQMLGQQLQEAMRQLQEKQTEMSLKAQEIQRKTVEDIRNAMLERRQQDLDILDKMTGHEIELGRDINQQGAAY